MADKCNIEERNFDDIESVLTKIRVSHPYTSIWLNDVPDTVPEFIRYINFINSEVRELINKEERLKSTADALNVTVDMFDEHKALRNAYNSVGYNNTQTQQEENLII